ncbi:MAG TPA: glycosyltransferase family 4 protein [Terriglobia bacterium]|nr:glycosyltransferase family 4 protein [Terriglobia bacterium]
MQERPRILFITKEWPLPPENGARQRTLNISRLLSRIGEVSFVIIQRHSVNRETVHLNMREFEVRMALNAHPPETTGLFGRLRWRIRHEFDPRFIATDAYAISGADRAELLNEIQKYDLVWIQDVKTADSCRIGKWPRSVLDTVDVPSNWYCSIAKTGDNLLRRLLYYRMSWIWKRRQRVFAERFDILTVCSDNERGHLGRHPRVHIIPNGFNAQATRRWPPSETPRIGFIGTCRYEPNREGVEWLASRVWPLIKRELPNAQLRLVGAGTEDYWAETGRGVTGLGWLEDPSEEIASWSAMVIPVRFGAGTRVKMAEGFARKCPIVATSTGAYGYGVRDGEEFLLAENPQDFASACIRLARDPQLGRELAERAHHRFLREWTWDAQEGKVRAVVRECLAASSIPAEVNPSPRAAGGPIHSLNV